MTALFDPTDDGKEEPNHLGDFLGGHLVVRDVDWSQCHVQLTAYGFA